MKLISNETAFGQGDVTLLYVGPPTGMESRTVSKNPGRVSFFFAGH